MSTPEEHYEDERREYAIQAAYNDGSADECCVCHRLYYMRDLTEGSDGKLRCDDHPEGEPKPESMYPHGRTR